jgi:glucose/arabinose dehydrogenase
MREHMRRLVVFILATALLFLAACQSNSPEETAVSPNATLPSPTINTAVPATNTPLPDPIITKEPTPTQPSPTDAPPTEPPPTPTPTVTPIPKNPVSSISLEPIASGLIQPLYVTHAFDDRLFIVEQAGTIRILQDGQLLPTPFLDILDPVGSNSNEQGLLGLAFHPNYQENGIFFLDYTDVNGNTNIARYHVSSDPNVADPTSGQILLTIPQPFANHNGGMIAFGPDG